jgi:hypothetical protein
MGLYASALLGFSQGQSQIGGTPAPANPLKTQHFVCNTGYSVELCHRQTVTLAAVLLRYPQALTPDWTWVLVRSADWPEILSRLNLNTHSPAFTVLARHQTFLSEALFDTSASTNAALLRDFTTPYDQMLEIAVTHELGHAFCMEVREYHATQFAEVLRRTGTAACESKHLPPARDTMRTLETPR